jgi:hypothetical protein
MDASAQKKSSQDGGPSVRSQILSVPKGGASTDEYEDAAAVRKASWPVRAAVADGATESAFARPWAETLAEGLCTVEVTPDALLDALPDWRSRWAEAHADRTEELPWYGAAKTREGAFATLLGLELRRDGHWRAVGVGDGLLLHLREGAVQQTWPHAAPDEFTNRPALLASRPGPSNPEVEDCRAVTGTWTRDDTFLLATDAVAAWLLRTDPEVARTWTADDFQAAVESARAEGVLRNDDSTLLVLRPAGPPLEDPAST